METKQNRPTQEQNRVRQQRSWLAIKKGRFIRKWPLQSWGFPENMENKGLGSQKL